MVVTLTSCGKKPTIADRIYKNAKIKYLYILITTIFSFSNSFLIQLFGGYKLVTQITISNICSAVGLSIIIGLVAWILPVLTALRINPVRAMQGAK